MNVIKLTYQAHVLTAKHLPTALNYFGKKEKSIRHEVSLYSGGLDILTYSGEGEQLLYRRHHDLLKNRFIELNEVTNSYTEHSSKTKKDLLFDEAFSISHLPGKRTIAVGKRTFNAESLAIATDTVNIELAYAKAGFPQMGQSHTLFLNSLLMGIPKNEDIGGLPIEISMNVCSEEDSNQYYLTLTNTTTHAKRPAPPEIKEHKDHLKPDVKHMDDIIKQEREKNQKPKHIRRFRRKVEDYNRNMQTHRSALTAGGADFYWCFRQSFLDIFKDTINPLLDGHSFYGDGAGGDNPMHLEMNLYNAIKGKLAYEDDFYTRIRRLLVYLMVLEGDDLPAKGDQSDGLTLEEQETYQEIIDDTKAQEQAFQMTNRYQKYNEAFGRQRRDEIADAYFDTFGITGKKDINFGVEKIIQNEHFMKIKIWDFDTLLDLNGDVIETFELRGDGTIRLALFIDKIKIKYRWSTVPNGSASSWACNIITLGACSFGIQSNYGRGFLKLDDSHLAFDLIPTMKNGELTLDVKVNADDTTIDIETIDVGVNPGADIYSLGVSAIVSWFDRIGQDIIVDKIGNSLKDFKLDKLLPWASNLHNINGPVIKADIGTFENDGAALAANVDGEGPFPRSPVDQPDLSRINQQGFLYSRRYLTAWLHHMVDNIPEEDMLNINISDEFDVELPDAASVPNDETVENNIPIERFGDQFTDRVLNPSGYLGGLPESCNRPPVRNAEYKNEVNIKRISPTVIFPENGAVDKAGQVVLEYDFSICAVKHSQVPHRNYVPPHCDRPIFGPQPEPFPGPQPVPYPRPQPVPYEKSQRLLFKRMDISAERPRNESQNGGVAGGGVDQPGLAQRFRSLKICEPAHCEWTYNNATELLHTYLNATIRVTADLMLGFDKFSNPWLPGVRLVVDKYSIGAEINDLTAEAPFDTLNSQDLKGVIREHCIDDTEGVLEPAFQQPISAKRDLVPHTASILLTDAVNEDIQKLISFQQSGQADSLSYEVINGQYLYWKFQLEEDLTNHLV